MRFHFRARRWITAAVLCVGLGAITALLVAWGCDVLDQRNPAGRQRGTQRDFAWAMPSRNGWNPDQDRAFFLGWSHSIALGVGEIHAALRHKGEGLTVSDSEVDDRHWTFRGRPPRNPTFTRVPQPIVYARAEANPFPSAISDEVATFDLFRLRQVGWPFWCLCQITGYGGSTNVPLQRGTLAIRSYTLCARPMWPGLLANLFVYTACWAAMLGSAVVMRVLLRNPGRCAACGYDLHGLPPAARCPECGTHRVS